MLLESLWQETNCGMNLKKNPFSIRKMEPVTVTLFKAQLRDGNRNKLPFPYSNFNKET